MNLLLIFIFSVLLDMGAVVFTRSVQERKMLIGVLTTLVLGALNWASIWIVVKQDDEMLMVSAIIGHAFGFVLGMLVPIQAPADHGVCRRCHPTTGPGSQNSAPS